MNNSIVDRRRQIFSTIKDLADEVLQKTPVQGYLTISNALQWRLQYGRVIELKNKVKGVTNFDWR